MDVLDRMRADWNARARKDAHFYVAFAAPEQSENDFQATAADVIPTLERELVRLPPAGGDMRRGLEIGCGPGRLLLPMSRHFTEIHGVDVSDEMIALARKRLKDCSAHVHVTSGTDLAIFENDYFDFVYSVIVFQHIPEQAIVLNYLREARRVLKPGGVLSCQLAGRPAPDSEVRKESATWAGCYFNAGEIEQFARKENFPLVALSGLNTQYMWATFRKPPPPLAPIVEGRVKLNAVTAADGTPARIPNRGLGAAVSLWIEGMPDDASLADFHVMFGDHEQTGCFLSPVLEYGACQINSRLPEGLSPGEYLVSLKSEERKTEGTYPVEVEVAPTFTPRLLSVTDGANLSAANRTESRSLRVTIEDVGKPRNCSFTVAGQPVESLQHECIDPITATFVFGFVLDSHVPAGRCSLTVRLDGVEPWSIDVEVAARIG